MEYRIRIDLKAQSEIEQFAFYAAEYDKAWALKQFDRLNRVFSFQLAEAPLRQSFFLLTGPPYRAYLFRVGKRTQFWIIYKVDEANRFVNVLRFWNARRDYAEFLSDRKSK